MTGEAGHGGVRAAVAPDPGGRRIYAIGDVHGRDDLFERLIGRIRADCEARHAASDPLPVLVMLGDYIDRGRQSPQVLDRLIALGQDGDFELHVLMGNHEEAMLDFIEGRTSGRGWARYGGRATMEAYGVRAPLRENDDEAWNAARDALGSAVPAAHLRLLRTMTLYVTFGTILFVHAGVRPGVPLEQQQREDLLGVRSDFLDADAPIDRFVVHGHTPVEQPDLRPGRLNLDTGAYMTGRLSAARFDALGPEIITSAYCLSGQA
jgi:hypothetical protein